MATKGPYRRQRDWVVNALKEYLSSLGFKFRRTSYGDFFYKKVENGIIQVVMPGRSNSSAASFEMRLCVCHKAINDLYDEFHGDPPSRKIKDYEIGITTSISLKNTLPGKRFEVYDFDPDNSKTENVRLLRRMLKQLHTYGIPLLNKMSTLRGLGIVLVDTKVLKTIFPYPAILAFALAGEVRAMERVIRKAILELEQTIKYEDPSFKEDLKEMRMFARKARTLAKRQIRLRKQRGKP